MSRHRFVRNLNIHDELVDDDIDEEDPFDGITQEQQGQLDAATENVLGVIGSDSMVSEKEIRKSLWDNYFDVDDTTGWAIDESKKRKSAKDKKEPSTGPPSSLPPVTSTPLSPLARLAAKSASSGPKVSLAGLAARAAAANPPSAGSAPTKLSLAGLAASRKKETGAPPTVLQAKSNSEQPKTAVNPNPPVPAPAVSKLALLAKSRAAASQPPTVRRPLSPEPSPNLSPASSPPSALTGSVRASKPLSKLALKVQQAREAAASPSRPRKPLAASSSFPRVWNVVDEPQLEEDPPEPIVIDPLFHPSSTPSTSQTIKVSLKLSASPSAFASVLAPRSSATHKDSASSLRALNNTSSGFVFDTPSPDDVVFRARERTRLAPPAPIGGGHSVQVLKTGGGVAKAPNLASGGHDRKAAAKLTSHPTSRTGTPTASGASTPVKRSASNTPSHGALLSKLASHSAGASTPVTPPRAKSGMVTGVVSGGKLPTPVSPTPPIARTQQPMTQMQADMDGLNLTGENDDVDVEPPPKMNLAREKVIEEAKKATESGGVDGKKGVSLIVIGHVDAGKSTLMGRLVYELGEMEEKKRRENERESNKVGKGSFMWAWEMDGLTEERKRGVTIDISQTTIPLPSTHLTILDAPGHKDFIPNMISGASQADAALLVVDAAVGEFEAGFAGGGQSREHVILVRSLGVGQLIVAVNKLDTVNYSRARYEEIVAALKPFFVQSGFHPSKTSFVPCAAFAGVNLVEKPTATSGGEGTKCDMGEWWKGPTLAEALDKIAPPTRAIDAPLRFPVSNVFKGGGMVTGVGASGRLCSGVVQVGERLRILPGDESAVVRAIEFEENTVPWAAAGSNVTLYLANIDQMHLGVGTVLCPLNDVVPLASSFVAQVIVFDIQVPIVTGCSVELFHHSRDTPATISKLIATLDRTTGKIVKTNPRVLPKSTSAKILISLRSGTLSSPLHKDVAIPMETFAANKEMGRILLRRGGETIAAGIVVEIFPNH